jgi:transposase
VRWLEVEWLPPYAPDLNPAEQVWNHTKYADLANVIPEDVADLEEAVGDSIAAQHRHPLLLGPYFRFAGL